ncbi:MAG: ferritin-like domain-containing protein [Acidobacteriota bacterium]
MTRDAAAVALDGGDLPLGPLLALVRPALAALEPGGAIAVLSSSREISDDLPAWCRVERHEYLGREDAGDGVQCHLVARGELGVTVTVDGGERASPSTGFAPRGARSEVGGPSYPFDLVEARRVAPPGCAELYAQAVESAWSAREIPWDTMRCHGPFLDGAIAQTFTFLAENELSALYVPSRFLPRIHPAYAEVAMLLAAQLSDEARHVDVFLRRARAAGGGGTSSVTTQHSLRALLLLDDFLEASFLLAVLGEGTFLDLLRYVEEHAPDDATLQIARRARVDEARHVHFGLLHVRHALAGDPAAAGRLIHAARRRAASLPAGSTVPPAVADALTRLAAVDATPRALARGHEAFRELLVSMDDGRRRRLESAGFTTAQAQEISGLHTPNFM